MFSKAKLHVFKYCTAIKLNQWMQESYEHVKADKAQIPFTERNEHM